MERDDVLVVDVEATCWEKPEDKPADRESEIIEVGLTVVNLQDLEIKQNFGMFVRPDYSEVSEFCTKLTTITQDVLDNHGIPFAEACQWLEEEFLSRNRLWLSWGEYDREQFFRDCLRKGVPYPFGRSHLNLKSMFALLQGRKRGLGVSRALKQLGLTFEGTPHRGIDDSRQIARILVELVKRSRT